MKNCFLFHLKSSFCYQDIIIYVLIRNIKLNLKFMMSQPGYNTHIYNTIYINCNTHIAHCSRSKGNQTMKFGQLIYYNKGKIFLQKSCRK